MVVRDLPDHCTAVGNPARILPDRTGEPVPDWALVGSDHPESSGLVAP